MTNEEAIDVLKNDIEICTIQQKQACEMAIKALEQTDRVEKSNFSTEQYKADLQGAYDCGYAKTLEQQPRWIPVTERLPEDFEDVLVWYEYFRYGDYNRMFQTYGIGCYLSNMGAWSGDPGTGTKVKVFAWMPLPQPYTESEEEE